MKLMLILSTLFLVSCASSRYEVRVASQAAAPLSKSTFKVVPGDGDNGLRFQKFAAIATKALEKTGSFTESDSPELNVKLFYSISSPTTETRTFTNSGKTYSSNHSVYSRKIVLKAYDKMGQEVWFTELISEGGSGNISEAFPYIMSAGIPYFGKEANTYKDVPDAPSSLEYLRNPASN